MKPFFPENRITLGVCYYPEQWNASLWRDDLRRMKQHGLSVVRIAEFAWNKFEPREGEFTFDFFDAFMDLAKEEGVLVIFGTPTATPPLWMSEKYPEILNADVDGNLVYHGTRRHNNLSSPVYKAFSRRITEQLAKHYSAYPNLIGWQLDNEINCECDRYYSKADHEAFRTYLKGKFSTLDALNEAMGTIFWNQTVSDWGEVYLTRRTNTYGETNPHFQLEEKRFISETVLSFFEEQASIIRKYKRSDQFVTTNGIFAHVDYPKLVSASLDFLTFDSYPNFAFESAVDPAKANGLRDRNQTNLLSVVRAYSPKFGVMEQQSGGGGWTCRMMQPMPKPGQMRLWTMQSIANGADYIGYFRWRTAPFGTEMYWQGLNDACNVSNRRLAELKQIAREAERLSPVAGSSVKKCVAILRDFDTIWDGEGDRWHGMCHGRSEESWFLALEKAHVPCDFLYYRDDTPLSALQAYRMVVACHPAIMTEQRTALLSAYVSGGGTLVLGCEAGYKTIEGKRALLQPPGYLAPLTGALVEESTVLSPFDEAGCVKIGDTLLSAPVFNDVFLPTDGETLGVYASNHYAGKPALVRKETGKGVTYTFGGVFCEDTARFLLDLANVRSPFQDVFAPESVELLCREKEGNSFLFVLNYESRPQSVFLASPKRDLLTGELMEGNCELPAYGVLVLTERTE
ncbi:MAG: beta-galactosidase [Christensenellaceae bacterium]